ncbi:hypothetical protein GH714_040454 [Hevea brasiliensis]|uniref:Exostosin GT47 domain-containing protein n=1 Tax=Hevea brasiliensis TaxID=3981 RepID=A0A6A6N7K0_HEVBR|nr:hypothetical protein GH714_040454 [Hevea brasiliensis]
MTKGKERMKIWKLVFVGILCYAAFASTVGAVKLSRSQPTERISGSAGDVLEDDPVGRLKVFVYELPSKYNKKILQKDPRCLTHMFAAEIFMHRFLLSSPVRTLNPEEADWFYTPEVKAIERGILHLLQRATLVQTFGQRNHVCLKEGSITVPPYAPPQKMQAHLIPEKTPRSIFVYFRGLFYDVGNDPEGGYYARGARAAVWENFKDNPLFDISTEHPTTYYEDMQRAVFCLCPLGWAPWSPRLVEAVIFGCIPVIIADDIVLPFADAIPWEEIGVFVDEKDVPNLDTILTSIPPEVILRKQRLLANPSMKQAMLFPQPAQPGDAFHQVLNGLARKLPHVKSIYLKPVCGAPKRRFRPYAPSVTKNANETDVRKARKAQIQRDEAIGRALPIAIVVGVAALAGLYFYLNSSFQG